MSYIIIYYIHNYPSFIYNLSKILYYYYIHTIVVIFMTIIFIEIITKTHPTISHLSLTY